MTVFRRTLILTSVLLLAGCGESLVRVSFRAREPLDISMLRVEIRDGGRVRRFTGSDFRPRGGGMYDSPEVGTFAAGTLHISYALVTDANQTVSRGELELPLRSDWRYGIDILPDTSDPTRHCFGCMGSRSFALLPEWRAPAFDSVYVVWGGNSIRNPVVY